MENRKYREPVGRSPLRARQTGELGFTRTNLTRPISSLSRPVGATGESATPNPATGDESPYTSRGAGGPATVLGGAGTALLTGPSTRAARSAPRESVGMTHDRRGRLTSARPPRSTPETSEGMAILRNLVSRVGNPSPFERRYIHGGAPGHLHSSSDPSLTPERRDGRYPRRPYGRDHGSQNHH